MSALRRSEGMWLLTMTPSPRDNSGPRRVAADEIGAMFRSPATRGEEPT